MRFKPEFIYQNEVENKLVLYVVNEEIADIELTCLDCEGNWWWVNDENEDLGDLADALTNLLDNISFTIEAGGVIKSHIGRVVHG